jgi:hypothetical protein
MLAGPDMRSRLCPPRVEARGKINKSDVGAFFAAAIGTMARTPVRSC